MINKKTLMELTICYNKGISNIFSVKDKTGNSLGSEGYIVYVAIVYVNIVAPRQSYVNDWAGLCFSKTSFIKTSGRLDLIQEPQHADPDCMGPCDFKRRAPRHREIE